MAEGSVKELLMDISDTLRRKAEELESGRAEDTTSGTVNDPTGTQSLVNGDFFDLTCNRCSCKS